MMIGTDMIPATDTVPDLRLTRCCSRKRPGTLRTVRFKLLAMTRFSTNSSWPISSAGKGHARFHWLKFSVVRCPAQTDPCISTLLGDTFLLTTPLQHVVYAGSHENFYPAHIPTSWANSPTPETHSRSRLR